MIKLFNSRKGEWSLELVGKIVVIGIILAVIIFGPLSFAKTGFQGITSCEGQGGVLSATCDQDVSQKHIFNFVYGKSAKDNKPAMICCMPLDDVSQEEFDKFKEETEFQSQSYFGVSANLGVSSWIPPNDGFIVNNEIYVKYNGVKLEPLEIKNFDNSKFQLEFANGIKDGKYCTIEIKNQEKIIITRSWDKCEGKAYMVKDFKGLEGQAYEIGFTVYDKENGNTKQTKTVTVNPKSSTNTETSNIDYSFIVESNSKLFTGVMLNKRYCVLDLQPDGSSFNVGNYYIFSDYDCSRSQPIQQNQLALKKLEFFEQLSFKNANKNYLCIFLRKNQNEFSKPIEVRSLDCDYLFITPPNNYGQYDSCEEIPAQLCLDINTRITKFSPNLACTLSQDRTKCESCPEDEFGDLILKNCNQYNYEEDCIKNECLSNSQTCYWNRDGSNGCKSCSLINSCDDYRDDEDCQTNACGVGNGCKWTGGFGTGATGGDYCRPK